MNAGIVEQSGLIAHGMRLYFDTERGAVHKQDRNDQHQRGANNGYAVKIFVSGHMLPHIIPVIGNDDRTVDARHFRKGVDKIGIVVFQTDFDIKLYGAFCCGFAFDR